MPKTSTTQPQSGSGPLGKIEVLPNAIHSIAVQATIGCYGVLGMAAPRLRNGQPVILPPQRSNQGIRVQFHDERLIVDLFIVLEYGLRISEIANNIMSTVKFSIEKMLGIPVDQVNINVQGLMHSPKL